MRRAMITNRPIGGLPSFTVGMPATTRGTFNGSDLQISFQNPAPRAGTLTTVKTYQQAGGTITIFTGTWDGSTFTVADAAGGLASVVGLNTFSVSLSIPGGGYLGWHSTTASLTVDNVGGSSTGASSVATVPAAGVTYSSGTVLTANSRILSLEGTGS